MYHKQFLAVLWLVMVLFLMAPLFRINNGGEFFSIDPDVMYVSNAISYTKIRQIHYIDHPGTFAIRLFSASFIPLRLIAKYIAHQSFIVFAIQHFTWLFLYLRLFQSTLLGLALLLIMSISYRLKRRLLDPLFVALAFVSYSAIPFTGIVISAEASNVLLLAIWLSIITRFFTSRSPLTLLTLSFISGILFANRLTNIFLVSTSLALVISLAGLNLRQRIVNLFLNLGSSMLAFLLVTWPIRNSYTSLFNWVLRLATSSDIHGGGKQTLFDLAGYLQSVTGSIAANQTIFYCVLIINLIFLIQIISQKVKLTSPLAITFLMMNLGLAIFAKYPLAHYQVTHLTVFLVTSLVLFSASPFRHVLLFLIILLIVNLPANLQRYYTLGNRNIDESRHLSQFIKDHPAKSATVWEWGLSQDFALLWGNFWSGGDYDRELSATKPNLYGLDLNPQKILINYSQSSPLYSICWDQIYIQSLSLKAFPEIIQHAAVIVKKVPDTSMVLIQSEHCNR